MPGTPDKPGQGPDATERLGPQLLLVCLGLLSIVLVVLGGVGLVVHHVVKGPHSPYQVAFADGDGSCDEDSYSDVHGLVLDRDDGTILYCGVPGVSSGSPVGTAGDFSGDETARVLKLAKSLAAEDGLSHGDQDAVQRLAEEIGQKHGYQPPSALEGASGTLAPWSLGIGLALFLGIGVWAHHIEQPQP